MAYYKQLLQERTGEVGEIGGSFTVDAQPEFGAFDNFLNGHKQAQLCCSTANIHVPHTCGHLKGL